MKVKHLIYIITLCFIVKYNIIYLPVLGREFVTNTMSNYGAIGLLLFIVDIFIIVFVIGFSDFTAIATYWNKIMNKEI